MAHERSELYPFAALIHEQRTRLSLSQHEVSRRMNEAAKHEGTEHCGATRQTIHQYEIGPDPNDNWPRLPRPDGLRWLAVALELPTDQLAAAAEQQRMNRRQFIRDAALLTGAFMLSDGDTAHAPEASSAIASGPFTDLTVPEEADGVVGYLRRVFSEFSTADWLLGPQLLLTSIPGHLSFIERLLIAPEAGQRTDLLNVGARYAEFASWLYQDSGKAGVARYWADRAIEWAQEADNPLMVSYVLARKSNQAAAQRDAQRTIGLARAAQRHPEQLTPRVLAVATQQEAYGHALAGNEIACHRKLDTAIDLAARSQRTGGDQGPGRYCIPAYVEIQRASCWLELGKPTRAVELFERQLAELPTVHRRDRGVYLSRLAVAHAAANNPDAAGAAGVAALGIAQATGSGRIMAEVRPLSQALARWRTVPAVAQFYDALGRSR